MDFFAKSGCDHVMVDMPDSAPSTFKGRYDILGAAIANSSNPNMLFGVWCSPSHPWKWAAEAGGHYWRMAGDIYDSWQAVLRQWDVVYSIPNIDRYTGPGRYSFLDQMIVGDVPLRKGSAYGPGLSHDQTVAHMSMW
jgi:alpha-galactosidase